MAENQVINRVNNISRKAYGGDALCALEQPSLVMVQNSNYWFLQFSCAITDNETNKPEKIVGSGIHAFLGAFWGKVFNFTLMVHSRSYQIHFISA